MSEKLKELKQRLEDSREGKHYASYFMESDIACLLGVIEKRDAVIDNLAHVLRELAMLKTVVAPDGRRWPIGVFALKVLQENGIDKEDVREG